MPVGVFSVLFIAAAAVLAVWIVVRFPNRAPAEFRPAMIHMGVSMVGMYLLLPLLKPELAAVPQPFRMYISLFGLLLPAFIYRLVSTIWLLRLAQGSLGSATR